MTDAEIKERARQLVTEIFGTFGNRILTIDGRQLLMNQIAAAMREAAAQARLEEAKWWRDYVCDDEWNVYREQRKQRIAELEAAVKSTKP